MQSFTTYISRGAEFSLSSMILLCQDALSSRSSNTARLLAKHASLTAIKLKGDAFPAVDELIIRFSRHNKCEAALELGTPLLKGGYTIGATSFRHILRSIFHVYSKHRVNHPSARVTNAKSLLTFLADWLVARQKCDQRLDQFDIAILIRGLSSLLRKRHHREYPLPASTKASTVSLLKLLSGHITGIVARFAAAESMLDDRNASRVKNQCPPETGAVFSYDDMIAWAIRWKDSPWHDPVRVTTTTTGAFVKRSRMLMILVRDRLNHGDVVGAIDFVNEIWRIHNAVSTSLSRRLRLYGSESGPQEIALLRRHVKDTQLRFVSALIRACSQFLKSQNAEALLLVLPLTKHLEDMDTFIRLWKRAFSLFVSLGTWQGSLGLRSLLSLFMESIPQGWTTESLGEILFASPGLLDDIARVASGANTGGHGEASAAQVKISQGDYLDYLARTKPLVMQELEAVLSSSGSSLPLSWRGILEINHSRAKTLSDSLLDRMMSSKK
jgi:hypothetical protein